MEMSGWVKNQKGKEITHNYIITDCITALTAIFMFPLLSDPELVPPLVLPPKLIACGCPNTPTMKWSVTKYLVTVFITEVDV